MWTPACVRVCACVLTGATAGSRADPGLVWACDVGGCCIVAREPQSKFVNGVLVYMLAVAVS